MWGEVLAAFVGAISGGAILALLTWKIYKKEKLASAFKILYELQSMLTEDVRPILSDHFIHAPNAYFHSVADTTTLQNKVERITVEIKSILRAHFPFALSELGVLEDKYIEYLSERTIRLEICVKIGLDQSRYEEKREAVNDLNRSFEHLRHQINALINSLEEERKMDLIPRIGRMFIFLDAKKWDHKKTPVKAHTSSQPANDTSES